MAAPHARMYRSMWHDDEDFIRLTPRAKLLYLFCCSTLKVTLLGSLDFSAKRWCKATGLTVPELDDALQELDDARFLLVDSSTEEVIVRTYVRHDGAWRRNRNMRAAIWNQWVRVESRDLRRRILAELPDEMRTDAPAEALELAPGAWWIDRNADQEAPGNRPGAAPTPPDIAPGTHGEPTGNQMETSREPSYDLRTTSFVQSSVDESAETRAVAPPERSTSDDDDHAMSPPGEPPAALDESDPAEQTATAVCDLLGDRDHARAVADGVRIRSKRSHREACRARARDLHWGAALTLARAHQDLVPEALAEMLDPAQPDPPPDPPRSRRYPTPEQAAEARERAEADRPPALAPAELAARAANVRRQLAHSA